MLSVIVCTYNRVDYLKDMIASFYAQEKLGDHSFEFIVVDNNSSDRTAEVCETFANESGFRYVSEPQQGLSFARNRGLEEAKGDLVAYLDDDVLVSSGWIDALLQAFSETDASVVGGRSLIRFESEAPPWFGEAFRRMLSEVDLGSTGVTRGMGAGYTGSMLPTIARCYWSWADLIRVWGEVARVSFQVKIWMSISV